MSSVLVVDDVRLNRDIVRDLLGGRGHEVLEATGGTEALASIRSLHPDVVVTDVLMPGMDGYELLREIRADAGTTGTPVIFYTANYLESEARPLADAGGVAQVVLRTEDPEVLIEAVERALRIAAHTDWQPNLAEFDRHHLKALNDKLITKVRDLHDSEEQFRIIADESPIGIVLTDRTATARYVNPKVADILELAPPTLTRSGWLTAYDTETQGVLIAAINGEQPAIRRRTCHITVSGEQRWLDLTVRRVVDVHGDTSGAVIMIDDVTDVVTAADRLLDETAQHELQIRQQLTERLDGLARMSGSVAHEFNNILAGSQAYLSFAIESLAEALTQDHFDADTADNVLQDLERSHHSAQRGTDLSRRLLAIGRHEITHPVAVDLNELITGLATGVAAGTPENIALKLNLTSSHVHVRVDPVQLSHALRHLLTNATEAMAAGGTCTITSERVDDEDPVPASVHSCHALVTVQDTGIGMSADAIAQAIDPFYTTKQRSQGAGLGLTTAYSIITQAGGKLSIESAPGAGTRVHIRLPVAAAMKTPPPSRAPVSPDEHSTHTILVVDDDTDVRTIVERILTKAGHIVITANDGEHALGTAQQHAGIIDCLITDVMMPVMNGHELAQRFRVDHPETPVLFISGYAAALINEQGILDPGSTVITKPFTRAELLQALDTKLASTQRS